MGGQMMDTPQQALADDVARRDALASHDRSLLVEAGAGSGKTAVMAGRIAMMLAEGIAPRSIAAVTFTELAASELVMRGIGRASCRERVCQYVEISVVAVPLKKK